jgi:hypothetical protein
VSLYIFPVSAQLVDCFDEQFVLTLCKWIVEWLWSLTHLCIAPFATVEIWIQRLLPSFCTFWAHISSHSRKPCHEDVDLRSALRVTTTFATKVHLEY